MNAARAPGHVAPVPTSAGQTRPAVVVVDVELRVLGPARWSDTWLFVDDALVQAWDLRNDPVDDRVHPRPIGRRIEEPDARDRGAQQRIAFDVPEHGVALAHPFVVVQLAHAVLPNTVWEDRDVVSGDLMALNVHR